MTIWNFIDDDELGMLMRVFGSVSFFEEASFEEANEVITKLKDVIDHVLQESEKSHYGFIILKQRSNAIQLFLEK
ncbi:hypothetical protein glysoja_013010 [Glycine soja]|nr:hypothetical protein JHK87_047316 [Glycine soja]KHN01699.1 hypothetical protein glysoja_013010 [Glycine soja]